MEFAPKNISRVARVAAVSAVALGIGLIDRVVPNFQINTNASIAEAGCTGPDCDPTRNPVEDCEKELRVAYLAGARKRFGEPVIAALTGRTAEIEIGGGPTLKVEVEKHNNSAEPDNEVTRQFHRTVSLGGKLLNYYAVPVGKTDAVQVEIHRLNIDGSRRTDKASNPDPEYANTCAVCGGPGLHTHEGVRTIKVFLQDSELGDQPGQYRNAKNDLVFQGPDRFFQGVDLTYLLGS